MKVRGVMTIAGAVLAAGTLLAQTAQWSGTWVLDRDKTMARMAARGGGGGGATMGGGSMSGGGGGGARMGGGGGGVAAMGGGGAQAPAEMTVTQTAATLTAERPLPNGTTQKFVFKLDGSESVNVNNTQTLTTKSHWDAGRLITEGTQSNKTDQGPISGTFKEIRSIEKDGMMVIETTRQFEGAASTTSIQVYERKK